MKATNKKTKAIHVSPGFLQYYARAVACVRLL